MPEGGFSSDQSAWIRPKYRFFLPVRVLSRLFRGKFVDALKHLYRRDKLQFHGALKPLMQPRAFAQFLRTLYRQEWVVYAKKPFGGPEHVLHYLSRHTHRVAISNHRLLSFEEGKVAFRWKDYAHGNKKRKMTLTAHEFIRRFLLHVLPRGFVRIRHFGWMANRCRVRLAAQCRLLLDAEGVHKAEWAVKASAGPSRRCPQPHRHCRPHATTPQLMLQGAECQADFCLTTAKGVFFLLTFPFIEPQGRPQESFREFPPSGGTDGERC